MRRTLAVAISALFLSGSMAAPALSKDAVQDHGSKANSPLPKSEKVPNTGGVAPQSDSTGSISGDDAINMLLSAISDTNSSATALSAMKVVGKVRVVRVRDIAKGNDARTVAGAVKDNSRDRKTLQSAIRSNGRLSARLKQKRTSPSQVVAAKIEADGSLTVYAE
jgi:hypothetical protein